MHRAITLSFLLIVLADSVSSQQLPGWSSYYESGFVWNPALTAKWNASELTFTHRQDWIGFDDAPQYSNISFQYPFLNRYYVATRSAIGGFIERDAVGPMEKINLAFTYNYRFTPQLFGNRKDVLGIGIVGNVGWYQFDLAKAVVYDPDLFTGDISTPSRKMTPNIGCGFFYKSVSDREGTSKSHYYLGLSVNQMIPNSLAEFSGRASGESLLSIQSGIHATLHAGYRIVPIRAGYYIEPNLMFIYALDRGVHAMVSLRYELMDLFWMAGGLSTIGELYAQFGYIFDRRSVLKNLVKDGTLRVGLKASYNTGSVRQLAGMGMEIYTSYVFQFD